MNLEPETNERVDVVTEETILLSIDFPHWMLNYIDT